MANKNPSPATRIKKGQVLNPTGRPKGILTTDQVKALFGKMSALTKDELLEIIKSPKSSILEITTASIFAKAAKDGDYSRLNFLLDRSIGRVVEEKNVTLRPVTYTTSIQGDGSLIQKVLEEGEDGDS
jgi:hypothetical protein